MRFTLVGALTACLLGATALMPHHASAAHLNPSTRLTMPLVLPGDLPHLGNYRQGHSAPQHPHVTKQHLTKGVSRTHHAASKATTAAKAGVSAPKVQMLALINAERAQAGVGPLRFDATLNAIAQARSQDMIARHYFSHHIPGVPGVHMVFDLLDHAHVPYEMAGENIALNNYSDFYPMTQTVQQTNTDLMNSPEHRANLLEPKYTQIGLGLAFEPGTGKLILTEVFVQP